MTTENAQPATPAPRPAAPRAPARAPSTASAPATPTSKLAGVIKGRIATPTTFVIYGPEGVGKTTLAASCPGVILGDIEDGSSELDVPRYPFHPEDAQRPHVPRSYQDVVDMIDDLTVSPHDFKALALDSLDRLEDLLWRHMLARDSAKSAKNKSGEDMTSIEDYGYGKGYNTAVEEWRAFCGRLDRLRYQRNMQIILVGHAAVRPFKNPTAEDYDRWQLRMNDKAAGFLKEWAKVTGFLSLDVSTHATSKGKFARYKAVSTQLRILQLARSAAVDAKTRLALPAEVVVPVDDPWSALQEAVDEAQTLTPTKLLELIGQEVARAGVEERFNAPQVKKALAEAVKNDDAAKLQRFLNELKKQPDKESNDVQG